jgi:ATP-dependent helicase/DNAse subunit B
MADLRLIICPDPRRLLEAAADRFLTPLEATDDEPFPSPEYLLVLRQGGLRDDLIRLAAERGVKGWFDPPLCTFHELSEWLGSTARKPLGDYERLVLLTSVLRDNAGDVLSRIRDVGVFAAAVDRLFGELIQEGVSVDQFQQAVERRAGDEFELLRDRELAAIYGAYAARLERTNRRDGRDSYVDCALALRANPEDVTRRLRGRREVRINGLHDLRGGWRPLLAALTESPALDNVMVYAADDSLLQEGLEGITQQLDEQPAFGSGVFDGVERSESPVTLIAAPDPDREAEEVARRVRTLVDGGTPLHRIGVVSRKARPNVDLMVGALARVGVPAAARLRIGFAEIPTVRSLLRLFRAAADGWTRRTLVDLAAQPYYANDFDVDVLNHLGYRDAMTGLDAWVSALAELERTAVRVESGDYQDEERRRRDLPRSYRVSRTRKTMEWFAARVRPLDETRTLQDWVKWLAGFVGEDPLGIESHIYSVPHGKYEIARTDLAGWKALRNVVDEWRGALETWGDATQEMDAGQFHEQLQSVLSGDAALWTNERRGVQVLEALAAVYRPFDHLFVVGMESGRFPCPAPRSPIIDDDDRMALLQAGLPIEGASLWDTRERGLFRILLAGAARSVTLSYVSLDELGELQAPSAFVDAVQECHELRRDEVQPSRVLTPGVPVYANAAALEQATHAARIERVRETGALTAYSGLIEDGSLLERISDRYGEDYVWNPSQLEAYATCPWGWFSARLLGLEKVEDPDHEMDAATRGIVLHDALARFFDAAARRKGAPVFLDQGDSDWIETEVDTALDQTIAQASDDKWMGHETLFPAKREELKRILVGYLEWEIELHRQMFEKKRRKAPAMVRTAVAEHERKFDNVVLERDGLKVRYRGIIDRVEVMCDDRVKQSNLFAAVDYKTTEASTPGGGKAKAWDDGVVLQVPLYAHALQTLVEGADVARVEYRALTKKDDKGVHRLQLYEVKKGELLVPQEKAKEKFERALDRVPVLVRGVQGGRFPAETPPTCDCPSWCHGSDICRSIRQSKAWRP